MTFYSTVHQITLSWTYAFEIPVDKHDLLLVQMEYIKVKLKEFKSR